MSRLALLLLLALSACALVVAHPHRSHSKHHSPLSDPDLFLQGDAGMEDFHPIKLTPFLANETTYYSYHIHGYFLPSNTNQTAEAIALRNAFIAEFNVIPCAGECDTLCPQICHWDLNMVPRGPHPVGSFGFYVPLENMIQAQNFISINHGSLSILIHPNSGYPIIDHGTNPMWIKQILPLDLSQLVPYEPPMKA